MLEKKFVLFIAKSVLVCLLMALTLFSCQPGAFLSRKYTKGHYFSVRHIGKTPPAHQQAALKSGSTATTFPTPAEINLQATPIQNTEHIHDPALPKITQHLLKFHGAKLVKNTLFYPAASQTSRSKTQIENMAHTIKHQVKKTPVLLTIIKIILVLMLMYAAFWILLLALGASLSGELSLYVILMVIITIGLSLLFIRSLFN